MSTPIDLHRPLQGDVIELILADHYLFEDLLRRMRNSHEDRAALREAFATLHVAHARAEELHVLPAFKRRAESVGAHEVEHGEEEHAEIIEALLAFLEVGDTDGDDYDEALENLATVVNHHSNEEEQTILNPAREEVGVDVRERLGAAWAARRNELLDEGCASVDQVAALLTAEVDDGTLAPKEAREEAEEIKAEGQGEGRGDRGRRQEGLSGARTVGWRA